MRRVSHVSVAVAMLLAASVGAVARAEDPPPTREEFNRAMEEIRALRKEVTDLKQARPAAAGTGTSAGAASESDVAALRKEVVELRKLRTEDAAESEERRAEIDATIKDVLQRSREHSLGETKLLITGDAEVGFDAHRHSPSTFFAGVAPRFLWKINDNIMFDAAFDAGVGRDDNGDNASSIELTIASMSYIVTDNLVVGGGLFVAPFAAYHRYYDPSWINKLPDDPLVFADGGLAPGSVMGVFISGAMPIGPTKINYALYGSNGPALNSSSPDTAGSLDFSNYTDLNNNKAVGGRIGFLPIPNMEIGYSFLCGRASADGAQATNAFLQAVDFGITQEVQPLFGTFTIRSEWVWSHVQDATYQGVDSNNNPWGPLTFSNNRNGGYAQISYRPTLSGNKYIRNLEGVFRYDRMDTPTDAPGGGHEARYALGLDYWFDARSVLKIAYECDDKAHESGSRAILLQFGVGF